VAELGVIAIGRNEGDRLRHCLRSALRAAPIVVYVDSDSTDQSAETARAFGASVVVLDASTPLGPSRARNAGFARLLELAPSVKFVQFVDGDCELADGWIDIAVRQLSSAPNVAIVCGRLRERFPAASIYNKLCEIEWDQPVGESPACGGIFMIRVDAFQQVGGFNPEILAGEESELCLRLHNQGWKILRMDSEMAVHDAAMSRFGQWWRRAVRCGYAYGQGARLHGRSPARHYVRDVRLVWFWGFFLPVFSVGAAWWSGGISLLILLFIYLAQFSRMYRRGRARPLSRATAAAYALSCILCRFAQIYGLVRFSVQRIRGSPMQLIEHR
jgi:GT2 family glycosyltransferase